MMKNFAKLVSITNNLPEHNKNVLFLFILVKFYEV